MKYKLISFIIPVYNVEKYIEECVESIICQDNSYYNIILVDDGSTDTSGEICDFYSNKYDFIETFHQINGGLSNARNTGIMHANSEYIIFVDSDDFIDKEFIDNIKDKNIEEDLILLNAKKFYDNKKIINLNNGYEKLKLRYHNKEQLLEDFCKLNKYPASACDKMIKTKVIIDNNLFFVKGQLSEDIEWTLNLLLSVSTINYINIDYYYYRQNRLGSITKSFSVKHFNDIYDVLKKYTNEISNDKTQICINGLLSYEYVMLMSGVNSVDKKEKKVLIDKLRNYQFLLKANKFRRIKFICNITPIFGLKTIIRLLGIRKKVINWN